MKYSDLTHEQRELVLWIENSRPLYKRMQSSLYSYYAIKRAVQFAINDYHFEDTVFKLSDKKAVAKYFYNVKEI